MMMRRWFRPRRMLVQGLSLSLVFWLVFLAIAHYGGATWPLTQDAWVTFVLLVVIVETLFLKIWVMIRRSVRFTRLGLSLIWFNVGFLVVYATALAFALWPDLRVSQPWINMWFLRLLVLSGCLWALVELVQLRDRQWEDES